MPAGTPALRGPQKRKRPRCLAEAELRSGEKQWRARTNSNLGIKILSTCFLLMCL
jgi:hypothetical protein